MEKCDSDCYARLFLQQGFSPIEVAISEKTWTEKSLRLNGKNVKLFGVSHTPATAARFGKTLDETVASSSLVVLETAPQAYGIYSEKMINLMLSFWKKTLPNISRENVISIIGSEPGFAFFSNMETLAAIHKKPVATTDPWTEGTDELFNKDFDLTKLDDKIRKTKPALTALAGLGFLTQSLWDALKEERQKGKVDFNLMGRRDFLKIASALPILLMGMSALADQRHNPRFFYRTDDNWGPTIYNYRDFRDVSAARGLDLLTRFGAVGNDGSPVTVIYGANHLSSVIHYLKNPRERDTRYALYAPYRRVSTPKIRIYKFDPATDWQLKFSQKI